MCFALASHGTCFTDAEYNSINMSSYHLSAELTIISASHRHMTIVSKIGVSPWNVGFRVSSKSPNLISPKCWWQAWIQRCGDGAWWCLSNVMNLRCIRWEHMDQTRCQPRRAAFITEFWNLVWFTCCYFLGRGKLIQLIYIFIWGCWFNDVL